MSPSILLGVSSVLGSRLCCLFYFFLACLFPRLSYTSNFFQIAALTKSSVPNTSTTFVPPHRKCHPIPTVCLMFLSSAGSRSATSCLVQSRDTHALSTSPHPARIRSYTLPTLHRCQTEEAPKLTQSIMSGFLSSDAEAALRGEEEESLRLFYQNQQQQTNPSGGSRRPSYQPQQWDPLEYPAMASSENQMPLPTFTAPSQYVSWPSATLPPLEPNDYVIAPFQQAFTPVLPSSPYLTTEAWPNAPWPALHPDDVDASSGVGASTSRSVSPNPADLHNFGILLSDGKTWRCGYPGCTSQAKFTRGCDLRKHFKRHTKSLFCRHDNCPQSREGGFSSKKDRDRHESSHKPGVLCSHTGCERRFSRVDNMKDHVRRIHEKKD